MTIAIIIPTYNERENIELLINSIFKALENNNLQGEVFVVDDNSPDGTAETVKTLAYKYPITLIKRECKLGLGSAYIMGFKKIMERKDFDAIVTMDADLSHNPEELPNFIKKSHEGYEVVLGSRYIKEGRVSWDGYRLFVSKGANILAKIILGLPASDVTTGFRFYKVKALKAIDLDEIKSNGYSFQEEILFLLHEKKFNITEIPIFFVNRITGESKLSRKEMLNFFLTILRLKFRNLK